MAKRLTQEQFIEKCKKEHPEYDYSITKYISRKKTPYIDYICLKHNKKCHQLISNFFKGCGCDECGKEKSHISQTKPFENFVAEANRVHNNEYEYFKEGYENTKSYINIKHKSCGYIFKQNVSNHLYGQYNQNGCPKCYGKFKLTTEEVIKKSKEIFGDNAFDYSKTKYVNSETGFILKCNKCGLEFSKILGNHINQKQGCPKCNKKYKRTKEEAINEIKEVFDYFDYLKADFKNIKTPIKLKCNKCGKENEYLFHNLIKGHGCSCDIKYFGEEKIANILNNFGKKFIRQKKYKNLFFKRKLKYDFYIEEDNLLIEYNGIQHYKWIKFFNRTYKSLLESRHRDWLKRKYAKDNKINILCISYLDDIEEKIKEYYENKKNRNS